MDQDMSSVAPIAWVSDFVNSSTITIIPLDARYRVQREAIEIEDGFTFYILTRIDAYTGAQIEQIRMPISEVKFIDIHQNVNVLFHAFREGTLWTHPAVRDDIWLLDGVDYLPSGLSFDSTTQVLTVDNSRVQPEDEPQIVPQIVVIALVGLMIMMLLWWALT